MTTERPAKLIIDPGGEERVYHARRSGITYNGSFLKNVLSINAEFGKLIAAFLGSLVIIGSSMAVIGKWLFWDKAQKEVAAVVRAEMKQVVDEHGIVLLEVADLKRRIQINEILYSTDVELEEALKPIIADIRSLERSRYTTRRDIERIK